MREKVGTKQIENILSVSDAKDWLDEAKVEWDLVDEAPFGDAFFFLGEEEVAMWVKCDYLLIIEKEFKVDRHGDSVVMTKEEATLKVEQDKVLAAIINPQKKVDEVYHILSKEVWFQNLSMDLQGEIAVQAEKMIDEKVRETRMEMLKEEMIRVEKQQESLQLTYEYLDEEAERCQDDDK